MIIAVIGSGKLRPNIFMRTSTALVCFYSMSHWRQSVWYTNSALYLVSGMKMSF